jgi:hypothetical protein
MNEKLITTDDLHAIFNSTYEKDKILEAICTHFKCTKEQLKTYNSSKWYYRSYSVFLLSYFGINTREISTEFGVSQVTVLGEIKSMKRNFFVIKETIDLFLFVLTELRKTQTHGRQEN